MLTADALAVEPHALRITLTDDGQHAGALEDAHALGVGIEVSCERAREGVRRREKA